MTRFSVWGPKVRKMELRLGSETVPMQEEGGGWWAADVAEAGTKYGFVLDGEGPVPDPRSPYQPDGVHGLSQTVDQAAFRWTDAHFQARPLAAALIYELHIGTFTPEGTFDSAIEKLDYLRDLGVTHVEFMPVAEFPGTRGWGYDGVDLYAPHHAYGGPDGLKRLVDACHARGLAVLLDVVYNHVGPDGNYLDRFGPYHSARYHTDWGEAMNFDGPSSDEVRRFFVDNARMWLRDYHFDGLRLDAVHAIVDIAAVHIVEEIGQAVRDLSTVLGRHLVVIAESALNDPRLVRPRGLGGYGLDAQWADDFHHSLHVLLTGETRGYYADFVAWDDLAKALSDVFVFDGRYSRTFGRRHGRPIGDLPAGSFVGYIQNHDQIGNQLLGERIGQLVGPELAKTATAIILTAPFVPMLFMGEEWNASTPFLYFTDHNDDLGRMVTEGRRREMASYGMEPEAVPDPQNKATFMRSKLDWGERSKAPHSEMLVWTRNLTALRRAHAALMSGDLSDIAVQFDSSAGWLLIQRGAIAVACNLSENEAVIPYKGAGSARALLASKDSCVPRADAIHLPPRSVVILDTGSRAGTG